MPPSLEIQDLWNERWADNASHGDCDKYKTLLNHNSTSIFCLGKEPDKRLEKYGSQPISQMVMIQLKAFPYFSSLLGVRQA